MFRYKKIKEIKDEYGDVVEVLYRRFSEPDKVNKQEVITNDSN